MLFLGDGKWPQVHFEHDDIFNIRVIMMVESLYLSGIVGDHRGDEVC